MLELTNEYLDLPMPFEQSPITAAYNIYNPQLTQNFASARSLLTDRYFRISCYFLETPSLLSH